MIIQYYEKAFGIDFDHFINNQPEKVKEAFSSIQKSGVDLINGIKDVQGETSIIAIDFKQFIDLC